MQPAPSLLFSSQIPSQKPADLKESFVDFGPNPSLKGSSYSPPIPFFSIENSITFLLFMQDWVKS
jgi:hypothetical protein